MYSIKYIIENFSAYNQLRLLYAYHKFIGGFYMIIKSVREISFFQNLRDKDINLCFCNFVPDMGNEETVHFLHYLVSIAKDSLTENSGSHLEQLDRDCLNDLSEKLEKHTSDMISNYTHVKGTVEAFKNHSCCMHALQISGKVSLTFVELINLYNVLDYFENNYESFKAYTKNNDIPHQILKFALTPQAYYKSIYNIKNNLEHKLGELIVTAYKANNK